jgi:hypothetical protein
MRKFFEQFTGKQEPKSAPEGSPSWLHKLRKAHRFPPPRTVRAVAAKSAMVPETLQHRC